MLARAIKKLVMFGWKGASAPASDTAGGRQGPGGVLLQARSGRASWPTATEHMRLRQMPRLDGAFSQWIGQVIVSPMAWGHCPPRLLS
eukprot:1535174-Pyramimonas_sp.AAC.1